VSADSSLTAVNSTLANVTLGAATATLSHSTATSVFGVGWTGLSVDSSWIPANVQLSAATYQGPNPASPLSITNSSVGGDVVAASQSVAVVSSDHLAGELDLRGFSAATISQSKVSRSVFLTGLGDSNLCSVTIQGSLLIQQQQAGTQLVVGADPQGSSCPGGVQVVVAGDVTITGNAGAVVLDHVTIGKNLKCSANQSAPVLLDVTAAARWGQCA
jgi:hypothetical protein